MNTQTMPRAAVEEFAVSHQVPAVVTDGRPTAAPPVTTISNITRAIGAVMGEIGVVEKAGMNKFHNYAYAKMEDILQRLTPLMARHGVIVFQTEMDRSMFDEDRAIAIRYSFTICHSSGEIWPDRLIQTGVSRCRDSKNQFDDKAMNKAQTAARKYFLLALFQIPTGDDDDADAHDDAGKSNNRPAPRPEPARAQPVVPAVPHEISANGAQAWAKSFAEAIKAAGSVTIIDQWVAVNKTKLDKLHQASPALAGDIQHLIKASRDAAAPPAAETPPHDVDGVIWDQHGERPATADDYELESSAQGRGAPAAKAPATSDPARQHTGRAGVMPATDIDIPAALDRRPKNGFSPWVEELRGAITGCEDLSSIAEKQHAIMAPQRAASTDRDWHEAERIVNEAVERVRQANRTTIISAG